MKTWLMVCIGMIQVAAQAQIGGAGIYLKQHPSCAATTISNCTLTKTASGGTSGSCASGYSGGCHYACGGTTWSVQYNSCALPTCLTYTQSGDQYNTGTYSGQYVSVGTQIYQQVGCNGNGQGVGYQSSYCNAALATCNSCQGYKTWTCGSDTNWY